MSSYYGKPILKPPVWTEMIAWYFFTGGLAGASATLALAARLRGNTVLARQAVLGAMIGTAASPVLLIADLHEPRRFHHMLRVIKPTSPMSIGTWILSGFGSAIGLAFAGEFLGIAPPLGRVGEGVAALLGPALATYTATLIADTAIPVWHDAGSELPFVFGAGAAMSAAGWAVATSPPSHAAIARRMLLASAAVEIVAIRQMQKRLGPLISEPYRTGRSGAYASLAKTLTVAGAAIGGIAGRKNRTAAILGGGLALCGAVCERFAVFHAGIASAKDPKYVVIPQRERLEQAKLLAPAASVNP